MLRALALVATVALGPQGIGKAHFGLAKAATVSELSAMFGPPDARGVNTGCSRRYTEVEWGDLAVEFRSNVFSGYRYMQGGYPIRTPGSPHETHPPNGVTPRLATGAGISLGSTLAQVRTAYRKLAFAGTDRWRAPAGLVFYDDAMHDPEPPSSRIVEIKIGTCGDF
jgi:hypothetical protein